MKTDPVAQVRAHIAGLPVPPAPPLFTVVKRRRPVLRHWLVPAAAALAVVAVLLGIAIRPGGSEIAQGDRRPTVPDRFARYSSLTNRVSDSPPGRAIALYQHGLGVELADSPQELVLSADGDVYRRVDLAESRGVWATFNERGLPPAMTLSADGTRIAIGGATPDLLVLDLATGGVTTWPAPWPVTPLAWSPDGSLLAAALSPTAGQAEPQQLLLYDMRTIKPPTQIYSGPVLMAAFSPDGQELAVQAGAELVIVDQSGKTLRIIPTGGSNLATSTAWSPDGRLLALRSRELIPERGAYLEVVKATFVDPTGVSTGSPGTFQTSAEFAGAWTGPNRFLLKQDVDFVEVDLTTGNSRRVSSFDNGPFDRYMMGSMQFASGLLLEARFRPAGSPERGPWPTWLRASVGSGILLLGLVVAGLMWLYRRRRGERLRAQDHDRGGRG